MENTIDWSSGIADLIPASLDEIRAAHEHRGALRGLSTGFYDLDAMTSGLRPGTLTIIGGRPSMGKTCFALNIVRAAIFNQNAPTIIITPESSREEVAQRLLVIGAPVDANRLRLGFMKPEHWHALNSESEKLKNAPLVIEDRSLTVEQIHENCRKYIDGGVDLKLVLVDYIQLLPQSEGPGNEKRITISRKLKQMALELNIAVIATSQLSRAVEARKNKRPVISDLREGAVDGDVADLILMLYRDEYYDPDSTQRGTAELIIAKQRRGSVGTIELNYKASTNCFSNRVINLDDDDDEKHVGELDDLKSEQVIGLKASVLAEIDSRPRLSMYWGFTSSDIKNYLANPRSSLKDAGIDFPEKYRLETIIKNHDTVSAMLNHPPESSPSHIICKFDQFDASSVFRVTMGTTQHLDL